MHRGAAACADLSGRGERLPAVAVAALRAAHARCTQLATAERDRLAGEVSLAARSRRAADAYGGR